MRKWIAAAAACAALALSGTAVAGPHHHGGPHWGGTAWVLPYAAWGVAPYVGGWYPAPVWTAPAPYYYPAPQVVQPAAPVLVRPDPARVNYYWCQSCQGYYPQVRECPEGWVAVPPPPAAAATPAGR